MTETMDDTEQAARMTPAEIGVMRQIIAWRKAREIEFVRNRVLGMYWVDTFGTTGTKRRSVAFDKGSKPLGTAAGTYDSYQWFAPETFTQAVDLLVALGYLPARFSSAYRAGWHAAEVWHDPGDGGPQYDEFKRLFHDPVNISFPAVGE